MYVYLLHYYLFAAKTKDKTKKYKKQQRVTYTNNIFRETFRNC